MDVSLETRSAQHAQPVALQHGLFLFRRQRKALEIGSLVGLEGLAVLRVVERHAEHVEVIADAPALGVVNVGSGNVFVIARRGHVGFSAREVVSLRHASRPGSILSAGWGT